MRMITRCPACGTGFRVYQEQLDARQGQVRCGHCAVVFNAHDHLVMESDRPAPPETTESAAPQHETSLTARAEVASKATELATPDVPTTPMRDDIEPPQAEVAEPPPRSEMKKQEPVVLTMADATQFDFGPAAPTTSRVSSGWWTAATLVLIAVLLLQGLYLFRTELARALPAARPALERACALLACEVPYPREAEQISIESSDLQATPGAKDVLVLSAVLRNRATFPQAYPAIELTLTDAADVTVARRVLRPRDYLDLSEGQSTSVFAAASEAPLKLHIDAAGLGASGYRLYVFYP